MSAGGETARNDVPEASGATPARDRVGSSRQALVVPEPGSLRSLARALVDLALALEQEEEEDERWTR